VRINLGAVLAAKKKASWSLETSGWFMEVLRINIYQVGRNFVDASSCNKKDDGGRWLFLSMAFPGPSLPCCPVRPDLFLNVSIPPLAKRQTGRPCWRYTTTTISGPLSRRIGIGKALEKSSLV